MVDHFAFNIKFVELVEKFPCIYNFNHEDHNKKEVVEKAWYIIGNELKITGKALTSFFFFNFSYVNKYALITLSFSLSPLYKKSKFRYCFSIFFIFTFCLKILSRMVSEFEAFS